MIFRKKALKTTAAAIAMFSMVVTGSMSYVHADGNLNGGSIALERALEDNSYAVKNKIEYVKDGEIITSGHGYQSLRDALSENTVIEVKNNKIYMTLEFTESNYTLIDNIVITVDGTDYKLEKSDDRKYTVELNSVDSDIKLNYDVNVPIPNVTPHNFTVNVKLVDAPELEEVTSYTLKNKIEYVKDGEIITSGHGYQSLRDSLSEDALIEVKNNKTYMTLEFTESNYALIDNVVITVDGTDYKFEKSDDRKYTIEINGVDSDIKLNYDVNVPVPNVPPHNFTVNVKLVDTPEVDQPETEQKPETEQTDKIKNGTYTVSNKVEYVGDGNSEIGNQMARNAVAEESKLVVKDGKITATLNFTADLYEYISNFRVSVDGKNVTVNVDKINKSISFEMPSIDSEVIVTMNVSMMGRDVSFKTIFDKSTLEYGDNATNNGNTNNNTSNNGNTNNGSINNNTNNSTDSETKVESTVKKGKLYTIQNTVSHSSETGKQMARKYLNSTSKVEIVDGETYVTLTFTGASFMQNHAIYVNGSKVSHTVVSKSRDGISLRFKVSELSDSIKVGMYVIPMSRNIEFGVNLLEDTLTFVKDFDLNADGSLPQTGSAIDSSVVMGAGAMMMAAGVLGRRKRK